MIYRPASSFYSNSIRLLSANVFSQSLTLLTFVLLARLYSVEDLGRFSFFLQLAALLTLLANGRYELVILLGKTRREATTAFQLCCMINIAVCVLILSPFLFFEHIRLLPLYIFVSALSASCSYWFNFNSRLSLIARYGIVQSLSANSLKALLGYIHPCVNGLLWADIIGYLVGIGSCITQKRLYSGIYYIHWREIWEMAYRFRHFPYFMLPFISECFVGQFAHIGVGRVFQYGKDRFSFNGSDTRSRSGKVMGIVIRAGHFGRADLIHQTETFCI